MKNNYGLSRTLIKEIIKTIKAQNDVKKIILFGSRARGDFKKTSDIDLAISAKNGVKGILLDLEEDTRTLLKFNVVDFDNADKKIKHEIIKDGVTLYEKT